MTDETDEGVVGGGLLGPFLIDVDNPPCECEETETP